MQVVGERLRALREAMEPISDTPEGILMEAMLEGYAEYYSAELAQKVTRGMTDNALKCRYNGGTLPIGYVIDKEQHFQIDPLTAPIIVEAFERYANSDTMKAVTDFLNDSGIRTSRSTGGTEKRTVDQDHAGRNDEADHQSGDIHHLSHALPHLRYHRQGTASAARRSLCQRDIPL